MEAPAGQPSAQDSSVNVVRENGHTTSTITFKESGFQETSRSGVSVDQRSKSRSLSRKKNQTGGNEQPGVTPPPPVLATSNLQKSSVSSSKGLPAPKKSTNEASKPAQPAASSRIVSDGPGASSEMPLRKPSASGGAGSTKPTKHKRQPSAGLNGHQTSPSSTMKASRLQTARDKKREPSKETKPAGKARDSTNPRKSQGGAAAGGQKGEANKPAGPGVAAKLSADEKALLEKLRKENEEIMAKMKALKEKTQQNKSALTQQKNKKADAEKEEKRKQDSKKQEVQKLADKIKHHQTDHEKALRDMLMIEKQAKKIKEAQEFARSLSEIRKQRDEARKQNEELNRERAKSIKQLHLNVCSKVDTFRKKKIEATKQAKSEMIEEVEKHKAVSLLEKEANRQSVLQVDSFLIRDNSNGRKKPAKGLPRS